MKFKNKEELSKAYDELEKAYTKECQENKKLREQLKLVESDQIKTIEPKEDEYFWILAGDSSPLSVFNNSKAEKEYIKQGNYFKTKEEAEKQAEYNRVMNRFRKYVEAYSEPLDWGNVSTDKWYLYYKYGEIKTRFCFINTPRDAFQIYASSEQILKDAIIYSAGSEEEFIRIVFGGKNGNNSDSTRCS